MILPLASGAEARLTNDVGRRAVVLVNGGQRAEVAGTWSATLEWLVGRLATRLPELCFIEVRYRVKSWNRLDLCVEDVRAALALACARGAHACALVGFSMGGAVAIAAAAEPSVRALVGLAPWIPDRLDVTPLAGRRFAVVHGALDRWLPGVPGVSPTSSRRGFDRAVAAGVLDVDYRLLGFALHGVAVRTRVGVVPLPRARRWAELLELELRRFQSAG